MKCFWYIYLEMLPLNMEYASTAMSVHNAIFSYRETFHDKLERN